MVSINKVNGRYLCASLPKPAVGLPVFEKHTKNDRSDLYSDVLYAKARNRSSGGSSLKNHYLESGDVECQPVQGREHIPVQTDVYLEELCDLIEEVDAQCETDPLLDRPASPLFVPASSGTDVATQIYPGDLFDFDREVQPLLECIVSETIEQSLVEIAAEEEVVQLENQQKEFEVRRNVELAEYLRLEEEERRLLEEKRRRLKEQDEAIQLEEEMTKKVAACVFAQNYLSDLLPKVYKRLERQGYFITQDPEIQEIEENFWPSLIDDVDREIATLQASCSLLDSLVEDAAKKVTETAVIRPVTPDQYPKRPGEEEETVEKEEETIGEGIEKEGEEIAPEEGVPSEENAELEATTDEPATDG